MVLGIFSKFIKTEEILKQICSFSKLSGPVIHQDKPKNVFLDIAEIQGPAKTSKHIHL